MRILITSDTHGDIEAWNKMFRTEDKVDLLIHAGDILYHGPRNPIKGSYNPAELAEAINDLSIPVLIARGNCDAEVDGMVLNFPIQESPLFCYLNGVKITVHHGHGMSEEELIKMAQSFNSNLVVSGHTHLRVLKKINDLIILNPGSISLPKTNDKKPSYAIMDNKEITIKDLNSGEVLEKIVIKQ